MFFSSRIFTKVFAYSTLGQLGTGLIRANMRTCQSLLIPNGGFDLWLICALLTSALTSVLICQRGVHDMAAFNIHFLDAKGDKDSWVPCRTGFPISEPRLRHIDHYLGNLQGE
jgi:hypothetical protein